MENITTKIPPEARECWNAIKKHLHAVQESAGHGGYVPGLLLINDAISKAKAPLANKLEELRNANTDLWAKFLNEEQQRKYKEEENTRLKEQVKQLQNNSPACGACAEMLWCGSTGHKHTCSIADVEKLKESIRVKDEALKLAVEWSAKFPLKGDLLRQSREDVQASNDVYDACSKALSYNQQ